MSTTDSSVTHTTGPDGPLTPSATGTLYFAYGSNLSPTQMSLRCTSTSTRSSRTIAIARLLGWEWIICARGCANVVETGDKADPSDEVWSSIYDVSVEDERIMDRWEGGDPDAPRPIEGKEGGERRLSKRERPTEQGSGRHNKLYLDVDVVQWNVEEWESREVEEHGARIRALVYVDEPHVEVGIIRPSHVGRLNYGIRERIELGLREEWVARAVRPFVPKGVEAEEGYVGEYNK